MSNSFRTSGRAVEAEAWRRRIAKIVAFMAPLIIAAVAILLVQQMRTANALRTAERAGFEQRSLLQEVLSAHQDVETGARGYVITGNEMFLEPYRAGSRQLDSVWPRLHKYYADRPDNTALVRMLFASSRQKQATVGQTIEYRRIGQKSLAEANVNSGRGKVAMDRIRAIIAELVRQEQARLDATSRQSEWAIIRLRASMIALLGILTVMLLAAWIAMQNLLRLRDTALQDVEDLWLRREAVLESATDGIVTLNPSGSIETANAATLRMFGYDAGQLDRRDAGVLFASQPAIGTVAQRLREIDGLPGPRDGAATEILGRRSNGSAFPTEVTVSVMQLNEGTRYVAVIRDVTERKRVEQLKSDFVATVSHELRTPLTSIAGALGLLSGGAAGSLDPRAERLISIAHNNADRLVRLVNDILDIERIESGKMHFDNRELDLKTAVVSSIEENRSYAAKFNVKIALSAPMTPMTVMADRDRLAQVMTNLLSNACKYSPEGGTVNVSISINGLHYRVTVADEGPGIPEEFRERIFGKFAQADSSDSRQKGGTGLGLSIVSEIVHRLNGDVSYESEPGAGARFHVDLPAITRHSKIDEGPVSAAPLLVCGETFDAGFSDALRSSGFETVRANTDKDVREALASRRFAGIIVHMGLLGEASVELIRAVRESDGNSRTPLLALGGTRDSSDFHLDAGLVIDWLQKPVDLKPKDGIDTLGMKYRVGRKPRILHVEDDPDVVSLVADATKGRADITAVDSVRTARSMLAQRQFDMAIIDLGLSDGNGRDILADVRNTQRNAIPVVIFSAQDADPAVAAMVDAYVTKARTPIAALVGLIENLASSANLGEQAA